MKSKTRYEGIFVDSMMYISIPTALGNSKEFYNIHYLVDLSSTYVTLTREAVNLLTKNTEKIGDDQVFKCNLGGVEGETTLSSNDGDILTSRGANYINRVGTRFVFSLKGQLVISH